MHYYTLLAADIGSFTVISAKVPLIRRLVPRRAYNVRWQAVSTFLATGFVHNVATITFWVSVLMLVTCAVVSTMFLNQAMHHFEAGKVRVTCAVLSPYMHRCVLCA